MYNADTPFTCREYLATPHFRVAESIINEALERIGRSPCEVNAFRYVRLYGLLAFFGIMPNNDILDFTLDHSIMDVPPKRVAEEFWTWAGFDGSNNIFDSDEFAKMEECRRAFSAWTKTENGSDLNWK